MKLNKQFMKISSRFGQMEESLEALEKHSTDDRFLLDCFH